jgi:hypothetical protein
MRAVCHSSSAICYLLSVIPLLSAPPTAVESARRFFKLAVLSAMGGTDEAWDPLPQGFRKSRKI